MVRVATISFCLINCRKFLGNYFSDERTITTQAFVCDESDNCVECPPVNKDVVERGGILEYSCPEGTEGTTLKMENREDTQIATVEIEAFGYLL